MIFAPIAFKRVAGLSNTVTNMGNSPSTVTGYSYFGYEIDNTANSSNSYLQIFNLPASQVVLGTTVPDLEIAVNGNSARGMGWGPFLQFNQGLSAAVTTSSKGSSAPSSAVNVTLYFEER